MSDPGGTLALSPLPSAAELRLADDLARVKPLARELGELLADRAARAGAAISDTSLRGAQRGPLGRAPPKGPDGSLGFLPTSHWMCARSDGGHLPTAPR